MSGTTSASEEGEPEDAGSAPVAGDADGAASPATGDDDVDADDHPRPPLSARIVLQTWWPLALSWGFMGLEIPTVSAIVARLPEEKANLGAFGTVVFPVALLIEAPIIMMLAASTALATDTGSYRTLRRWMTLISVALTALHALVAFVTPLREFVATVLLDAPPEMLGPVHLGLVLMLPWTWAIADRRFHQGVLIRFDRQIAVSIGTFIRLASTFTASLAVLAVHRNGGIPGLPFGLLDEPPHGIAAAGFAMSTGVLVEAFYVRACCRRIIHGPMARARAPKHRLDFARFLSFYGPLALTPVLALAAQPIGGAGINRMPLAASSAAAWTVLQGVSFIFRSLGMAYNEVVVRHAGDPGGERTLFRFGLIAGISISTVQLVLAASPLSTLVFEHASNLEPEVASLARTGLLCLSPVPLLYFGHSYWQGRLVHAGRTRGITEATGAFLLASAAVILLGIFVLPFPGAATAALAIVAGGAAQAWWLARRCRGLDR